ncbi:MAG TPA: hypothetical protein PLK77_09210 [Pyrinomonadaceae bacterium]|nr:hypothetical protein [Pyrinomonadaceae bacterium]
MTKISAEELVGEEWAEWYRLTPMERFRESEKLWETYLSLGGSLDPEPDTQSPFFDRSAHEPSEANREIWRALKAELEHLRRIRNKA